MFVSAFLILLMLVHMVIAFVASTAVLSIPSGFLKFRYKYVILSLFIPFFGVIVLFRNGYLLPNLHQAYSDLSAKIASQKQIDSHVGHPESYDSGDSGE